MFIPAPAPPSTDYLCRGNFVGGFSGDRDAYLAFDDTRGDSSVYGTLVLEGPEARYNISGSCERTGDGYANVSIVLIPGSEPYNGEIYDADDGQVYLEATQDSTGAKFTLQRQ